PFHFQYDEACKIAGPLNPLCVNSIFSRKLVRPQDAVTTADTPANSQYSRASPRPKTMGTSPGRRGTIECPNCLATSYPKAVAPILEIESPPVATTSALPAKSTSCPSRLARTANARSC